MSGSEYSYLWHPSVIVTTAVRIAGALVIFIYPLWGFLLTGLLDILDAQVLIRFSGINRAKYHVWDKNVDWLTYIVMLTYGSNHGFFLPLFLLLFLRFFGQFMFMKFRSVRYFILFPNIFESVFLWFILFYPVPNSVMLPAEYKWLALGGLIVLKYLQEISLHLIWTSYLLPKVKYYLKQKGIRYL